jgi:glucosamine--fructose-6-phosphate aminotransferase (isomerizing)
MCGIVGYVGEGPGLEVVLDGLRRLEYRGYDSAGVAVLSDDGELRVERRAGKLANLEERLGQTSMAGSLAIGHTRWATHGPPTDRNAHPHISCEGDVAVVHNGTIENFEVLVAGLEERGHQRRSDTDTEVVAHLVEERVAGNGGDLAAAVREVSKELEGSFVLVVAHRSQPDLVVAARRNLPLVIGLGDGENFVGSDVTAFIGHTREARAVEQDQVVEVRRDGRHRSPTSTASSSTARATTSTGTPTAAEKGGYEYFMLKEIDEQPQAVRDTLGGGCPPTGCCASTSSP